MELPVRTQEARTSWPESLSAYMNLGLGSPQTTALDRTAAASRRPTQQDSLHPAFEQSLTAELWALSTCLLNGSVQLRGCLTLQTSSLPPGPSRVHVLPLSSRPETCAI